MDPKRSLQDRKARYYLQEIGSPFMKIIAIIGLVVIFLRDEAELLTGGRHV
jgi:hypothetical protein